MLNVVFFTFNAFEENTWLLINERKHCWIIDPGMYHSEELATFNDYITRNALVPQAIINTHAHLDHIFGVQPLMDKYNIPFAIHKKEQPVLDMATSTAAMFGFDFTDVPRASYYISEHEPLKLGNDELEVRFTPGHSPGSISYYYAPGNWVVSGDVLFAGSIGRTDLPGGNHATLISSIKTELLTLPGNTQVLSGHGPATHIEEEKNRNPFLK
jgi:glyoxylase-like metal-dependent hydrolase (beta-lactamase superfamily II)